MQVFLQVFLDCDEGAEDADDCGGEDFEEEDVCEADCLGEVDVFGEEFEHDGAEDRGGEGVEDSFDNVGGADEPIVGADHFHDGDFFFAVEDGHLERVDDDQGAAEDEGEDEPENHLFGGGGDFGESAADDGV